MKPLTLVQIRHAVQGRPLTPPPTAPPTVTSVCTDTRQLSRNCLFIALRGERFDGHEFISQAVAGGAVAALVEEAPANLPSDVYLIQVKSTRRAMGQLANCVRQTLRGKVIAVAGSNGKTSTKHLIDAALAPRLRGSTSPKSFNNDIGVPLTIFPADPSQDYLVLEIGTNHPGEIKNLSDIAQPDVAVITNCGAEHLEGLVDLMGVRRENAAITSGLRDNGVLVVNGDDEDLLEATAGHRGRRITFGFERANDLFATDVQVEETGTRFRLNGSRRDVFVPMLGRHAAANALAAIAVGRRLGVPEELVISGLAHSSRPEMRLALSKVAGVTLLNDAYNANPNSMRAALETAIALPVGASGRRVAVLGDMRELGEKSERYHRELGQLAAQLRFDLLACIGEHATYLADAALAAGHPAAALLRYESASAAAADLPARISPGDLVLIKASRGIQLETVAKAITQKLEESGQRAAS